MKNKIILLLIAIVSIYGISSCKKKSSSLNNNGGGGTTAYDSVLVPYTKSKEVPAIPPLPGSIEIPIVDTFATKVDEYLSTFGPSYTKSDIIKLNAESLNITIDNASSQTFDFINPTDTIKVEVDQYNGTKPTLVAYKTNIPPGAKTLEFDVIKSDVKDYFNSDYMQVSIKFKNKPGEGLPAPTMFITNFKFKIKVKKK